MLNLEYSANNIELEITLFHSRSVAAGNKYYSASSRCICFVFIKAESLLYFI
jgi:hypothetical protein